MSGWLDVAVDRDKDTGESSHPRLERKYTSDARLQSNRTNTDRGDEAHGVAYIHTYIHTDDDDDDDRRRRIKGR